MYDIKITPKWINDNNKKYFTNTPFTPMINVIIHTIDVHLMVPWNEMFLFQNMLPIKAFNKVGFFIFQDWLGNFAQMPSFQNIDPWNWGMDFLFARITFSMNFLVALNTIAWVYLLL